MVTVSCRVLSVNSAPSLKAAAAMVPHSAFGVTTVGQVRAAGGTVARAPTTSNPTHRLINGCSAETLSRLFNPTIRKPK